MTAKPHSGPSENPYPLHLVQLAPCFAPLITELYADRQWEKPQKGTT